MYAFLNSEITFSPLFIMLRSSQIQDLPNGFLLISGYRLYNFINAPLYFLHLFHQMMLSLIICRAKNDESFSEGGN